MVDKTDPANAVRAILDVEPESTREFAPASVYESEPEAQRGNGYSESERKAGEVKPPPALAFRHIGEIVAERREPRWILHKILERDVLAVIAGPRGSFKSFIALDWAMRAALLGHGAVILSGEGAGLDRRIDAWLRTYAPSTAIDTLPVVALERPVNLNVAEIRAIVANGVRALAWKPLVILVDTLSKFTPGLDENKNADMSAFLGALTDELRDALSCTVLLVAHTGHNEQGRPRGAYALMANPDAEYITAREGLDMAVTVTRDRFKDTASLPPMAYAVRLIDLERVDSYGDRVTSLALESVDAPAAKPKFGGINQQRAIAALKEWARANHEATDISSIDITGLFRAQGLSDRRRRREVLDYMVNVRILTPSIGGYTFDQAML